MSGTRHRMRRTAVDVSRESVSRESAGAGPRYLVLGPLEVRRAGAVCTPSPLKHRALLAVLLLHANRLASADMLIDELWDGHPPRSAAATLQMYVSGLRRTLDPEHGRTGGDPRRHPVLRTAGSGYVLSVAPGELDLDLCRALAARGRRLLADGDCGAASESFSGALSMWRGRPLADLGPARLPAYYAVRLEEERLALLHDRIGADICAGRAQEVVADLAELCARHPLREAFHEQLMLALACTGRMGRGAGRLRPRPERRRRGHRHRAGARAPGRAAGAAARLTSVGPRARPMSPPPAPAERRALNRPARP